MLAAICYLETIAYGRGEAIGVDVLHASKYIASRQSAETFKAGYYTYLVANQTCKTTCVFLTAL